jgi:hypothetical protein
MPIKPLFVTEMDLARSRQIVRSLTPLKGLSGDEVEFVARTIAQCFAKGREQGLHHAKADLLQEFRGCCHIQNCPLHSIPHEQHPRALAVAALRSESDPFWSSATTPSRPSVPPTAADG